jgi:mannose-1-phosphate guanylyltransferase
MQALVLVGGEGTRLRPLTLTRPKPALQLVDRPFIRFMVDWLGRHGIDDVVMACGFRAGLLKDALGERTESGGRIRYVSEDEPLGTAGPIRLAADSGLLGDRFMVLNGDVLTDLDLTALQAFHAENDAIATLGLYPVDDPASYGLVRRDQSGAVQGFLEKPDPDEIDTDEISAGAYVLERAVVNLIPPGRSVSIERDVFPRLVGQGLFGLRLDGYWMDIGTPERYLQASWDIVERRVETDVETDGTGPLVAPDASVAEDAHLGPRVVVAAAAEVGSGARVDESVILRGTRVGSDAEVMGSILGEGVEVGEGAHVLSGTVVGDGAVITPGARVAAGSRVEPSAEVAA